MAKAVLPTDFQDDILNASMNGKRRYRTETNPDGTISFIDVSQYDQVGSDFGAGQINQTNAAVNEALGVTLTATLAAGATSVSFTNSAITSTALIDIYADTYGVSPKTANVSGNTLTLTFTARSAAVGVTIIARRNV